MINERKYPRPEFVRGEWLDLCGKWEFEFDFGKTGEARGVQNKERLEKEINVPYCPESRLSGIEYTDFINACWYRKSVTLTKKENVRTLINFEAVCHYTKVFVNGKCAGEHTGGYTPFTFDITDLTAEGENAIAVYCENDPRDGSQPSGKQSAKYGSYGCYYTRSTGIYQPVWIEYVPDTYLKAVKLDTDIENSRVLARLTLSGAGKKNAEAVAFYKGKEVGKASGSTVGDGLDLSLDVSELHLWEVESPELYDLVITVNGKDTVKCLFGMRSVRVEGKKLLLNNKPVFMRLVLDQGYYPDGIYTEPDDEALKNDILLSKRMGFNGARLHQRVFSRRFLYYADTMGYLVWGEYASWGFNHGAEEGLTYYLPEWLEAMDRDYNHPALIGWCPFNETWDAWGRRQQNSLLRLIYEQTKRYDRFRPVIDVSGNYHVVTDIYDIHDYNQKPETLYERYGDVVKSDFYERFHDRQTYNGTPFFVSEYGGIKWAPEENAGWGYGDGPKTVEEYISRYCEMAKNIMTNPDTCGLCYTQLYDVEQERNGIYYYSRKPKFTDEQMNEMRDAMLTVAACEK